MNDEILFDGFEYAADRLQKFLLTAGIFTLSLKQSAEVVHYSPDDTEAFRTWLLQNGVEDMRKQS